MYRNDVKSDLYETYEYSVERGLRNEATSITKYELGWSLMSSAQSAAFVRAARLHGSLFNGRRFRNHIIHRKILRYALRISINRLLQRLKLPQSNHPSLGLWRRRLCHNVSQLDIVSITTSSMLNREKKLLLHEEARLKSILKIHRLFPISVEWYLLCKLEWRTEWHNTVSHRPIWLNMRAHLISLLIETDEAMNDNQTHSHSPTVFKHATINR